MTGPRVPNGQQRRFAEIVARTGDKALAARECGYSRDGATVAKAPTVAAEIVRQQRAILATEALPKATRTLMELMDAQDGTGKAIPAVVRLGAARAVVQAVERGGLGDAGTAEAHAMTAAQLAEAIRKLQDDLAAGPVIDLQAEEAQVVGDIFD